MYRIEVASGEETVFRTIEELAVAIRNGVVTPRSRIYHNASQKWLPIGLHPHYKKALELPVARTATSPTPTPVPAQPRLRSRADAPPAPKAMPHATPPAEPKPIPMPAPKAETRATDEPHPAPEPAARKVPAPVTSPVVTMQQEVLRDLPVVVIPEPLPWTSRPAPVDPEPEHRTHQAQDVPLEPIAYLPNPHAERIAPAPIARIAQAVQAQPTATVTYTPLVFAEPAPEPAHHEPEGVGQARPTARRSRRAGGRPLLLLGAAAALVLGAHFALTATPSASADATELAEPRDPTPEPAASEVAAEEPDVPAAPTATVAATSPPARVSSASARVPMVPGPAFSGSVPARPGTSPAVAAKGAAPAPAPAPDAAAPIEASIAPAPAAIDLALPDLSPDSVVPASRTADTMGMKKILRALNGAKSETPAAP